MGFKEEGRMNYFDHWKKAYEEFTKHYDKCADRNECYDVQERMSAEESWKECEQIKMLDDGSVKIKWEHRCWWADCHHYDYYCILAAVDKVAWEFPYDLAKRKLGEGEQE